MRWQHLTGDEIGRALADRPLVLVPIGSTEQHGPIGLAGTDALCAEIIGLAAGEKGRFPVAPPLAYTPAQFNDNRPGTISVRMTTLIALIGDLVESLGKSGVEAVYLLNAHGANAHAIHAAVHDLYGRLGEGAPRVRMRAWWSFPAVRNLIDKTFGAGEGLHATPSEISIVEHAVRRVDGPRPAAPPPLTETDRASLTGDRHGPATVHSRHHPDGRVGSDSALASPDVGAALIDTAASAVSDDALAFLNNKELWS